MEEINRPIKPELTDFNLSEDNIVLLQKKKTLAKLLRNVLIALTLIFIATLPCFIIGYFSIGFILESLWFSWLILAPLILFIGSRFNLENRLYSIVLSNSEKIHDKNKKAFDQSYEEYNLKSYAIDRVLSRSTWEFWLSKTGQEFEEAVASLFLDKGYEVTLTGKTNDKGIDMILIRDGKKTIVQCKLYKNRTPPNVARELYGTMMSEKADDAILVAPRGFSLATKEFVQDKPIQLYDIDNLTQSMFDFENYTPYWLANSNSVEDAVKYANKHLIKSETKIKKKY